MTSVFGSGGGMEPETGDEVENLYSSICMHTKAI